MLRRAETAGRGRAHPAPSHPARQRASRAIEIVMRATTGEVLPFDFARWHAPSTPEEEAILAELDGPVIDLGCGPGRLVLSLARRRVPVLGVDSSASAVALARSRGASVLERDLFGPLPGEGRWRTALLFDGNIGIGGDPRRLLARCRAIAGRRGRVVVEVESPGVGLRHVTARLERGDQRTAAFGWAIVGADAIFAVARGAGLVVTKIDEAPSGRRFAHLQASAA